MALPSVIVRGKKIILLSGYKKSAANDLAQAHPVLILAEDGLQRSAKRNPDAVAFGYIGGQWFAAA